MSNIVNNIKDSSANVKENFEKGGRWNKFLVPIAGVLTAFFLLAVLPSTKDIQQKPDSKVMSIVNKMKDRFNHGVDNSQKNLTQEQIKAVEADSQEREKAIFSGGWLDKENFKPTFGKEI